MKKIEIETNDGRCPTYVFHPSGTGPWPVILVFMDGIGIRPAVLELADRVAQHGYFVVLPDLFYRVGPYEPMDAMTAFSDPEKLKVLREKFFPAVSTEKTMSDTQALLDWIEKQPEAKKGGIGVTGYCMGGRMALLAAGTFPEKIVAAASYHPGRVATDTPDSPHLLAPKMKATVYVAGATDDASFPEDMKARLEAALTAAGVKHTLETYPAKHGWVFPDTPVYDEASAERHWQTLFGLMDGVLKS